jgi:hypothetical protein
VRQGTHAGDRQQIHRRGLGVNFTGCWRAPASGWWPSHLAPTPEPPVPVPVRRPGGAAVPAHPPPLPPVVCRLDAGGTRPRAASAPRHRARNRDGRWRQDQERNDQDTTHRRLLGSPRGYHVPAPRQTASSASAGG